MSYISTERVVIEQLYGMPDPAPDLSRYELFVRLGCQACPNAVNFKAKGITSPDPSASRNPVSAGELQAAIEDIDKRGEVLQEASSVNLDACASPCPQLGDIAIAVELINDRFFADLRLPS